MRLSLLLLLVVICPLFGQSSGSGRTTITGTLDTRQPPPAVQGPLHVVRRPRLVLPPGELAARQQELLRRRPSLVVPPGVEKVDLLARGQAPSFLGGQSLAMNATRSFAGIPYTFFEPPSPDVAVGPVDVLQTVHSQIARYNKNGQKLSQMSLQQWFASILPQVCPSGAQSCNMFDPSIRYDSLHGRFLILAFSEDQGDILSPTYGMSHFVLSVSNGATYESGFKHWALRGNLNGTTPSPYETDYPQMGYDNNCVYLTGNMWDPFELKYGKIRILKKSELYRESTTALTYRDIWDLKNEDGSVAYAIRPAQVRGAPGTGTPPGILVNASLVLNANYLTLWRIPNPTGDNPTAERTTLRSVWPYDFPADFQTLGTVVALDAGDSAVLKAIQRNGILYTARNAGYPTATTTVTYDRIDLARNAVTFQARHVGGNYFFPAFDMPASQPPGNTVLDKLITGSSTDANGALTYVGVPGVKDGEDSYYNLADGRYGDFFGGTIDPVEGGLWVAVEYAAPRQGMSGRWGTWLSYFPWVTAGQFTDVSSSSPLADFVNVMKYWGITGGCTPTTYCPGETVTRGQMAAFLVRALLGGETFAAPTAPYFTDVPANHAFFRYVQKLRELGVTTGCTATTYCPDGHVTRGEVAALLIRAKMGTLIGDDYGFPTTAYFTDVPASHPFFRFVQKMRELGVTSGCTATTFCVNDPMTREQMAALVARALLN